MSSDTVIVATCQTYPHPSPSLELLISSLTRAGVTAKFLPWKTTDIGELIGSALVLPLCCWDSHHDPIAFRGWINNLSKNGIPLLNDRKTVLWNLNKNYLIDLEAKGVPIPASQFVPDVSQQSIRDRMENACWTSAVIKPVYGESGDGVSLLHLASANDWSLNEWYSHGALLQEFVSDILDLNETTMFFIDGKFSHAVKRNLPRGEWRANLAYGAELVRVELNEAHIEQARSFLSHLPLTPLYARVDGIVRPEGMTLMELELIDPYPHFEFADGSADTLAQAIVRRISSLSVTN